MSTGTVSKPLDDDLSSENPPFVHWMLLAGIILPILGAVAAMVLAWNSFFGPLDLILLVVMYLICGFGITIGFHRYFSHKSFNAPRWMVFLLGFSGSMAMQGPMFWWVATHRAHHKHSDQEGDPHSPHAHEGHGFFKGFWHAHMGWLFNSKTEPVNQYISDLKSDPMLRWIDRNSTLCVVAGMVIPAIIGGLISMSWMGALTGFIWGGLIRVLIEHHVTWSVNSICHIWGAHPFQTSDKSRNNLICGFLALGEGWHNNHHAFPTSARHGLRWWQFDSSWMIICCMQRLGIASKLRTPSEEHQKRRAETRPSEPDPVLPPSVTKEANGNL
jgi:stearoyl-CoA desaturase (delta-9 desaturase)